ncbi:MAG: AMP-binding protein [Acidimicrobiales bacterium]
MPIFRVPATNPQESAESHALLMNLATIIDAHPGEAVALISRRRTTTYGDLRAQAASLRGGLAGLGLEPGDRVAILAGNNWYFVASYLGVLGAGLVAVPLNPLSPSPEIERQLAAVGARGAIVAPTGKASFAGVDRGRVPSLEHIVYTDGDHGNGRVLLDDLLAARPAAVVERADDDLAVLLFTAGTAGAPKAAMLTHGNLLANLEQLQASPPRRQGPDDTAFGVIPLFHIFGLNVVLGLSLAAGSRVLLIERFDPSSALDAIQTHGVTLIAGAPTMWAGWSALPGLPADAFASVRLAVSGAARLPIDVAQSMQHRFGLTVAEGYGLTEAAPVVTSAGGLDPIKPGSIGSPLPGVEVRLVDPLGEDVLVGDEGEVWVRGPNVFHGYWDDPDATEAALTPDGWLRTGDIGVVDDDGFLFLVDRAKDIIIVSGFNVYPGEVEEVLAEHPAVEAAAVVGVEHPHSGEAVKAFVVVRDGKSVEEDEVIAFCAGRLARYKCPDKVMFVDELPHGLAGKLIRRELRSDP